MRNNFTMITSALNELPHILASHKASLANPFDSYCEDMLEESIIYRILREDMDIGYAGMKGEVLWYFHVLPSCFRYATDTLEYCISQMGINRNDNLS